MQSALLAICFEEHVLGGTKSTFIALHTFASALPEELLSRLFNRCMGCTLGCCWER